MRKEIVEALIDDAARRLREQRMTDAIRDAIHDRLHAERMAERRRRNGN